MGQSAVNNEGPPSDPASVAGSEGPPPIECKGLWKIYGQRDQEALRAIQDQGLNKSDVQQNFDCVAGVCDASFNVETGEIFCVMGLSGSGKSTLVRHINRLIEPTAGHVFINGVDVNSMGIEELRRLRAEKIGMVFQNMALLPHRTVRQNIGLGLELRGVDRAERNKKADHALEVVHLEGWGHCYPDELSGGMQQRVGLARALAADPDILLMDEPFSALDPLIRRQLQDQFLELSSVMKKTTIFITHDLDEAIRLGDRIAIMKDGVLVQIGSPEEIVTEPADEYVADFVASISRLHLVRASTIMWPYETFCAQKDLNLLDECPTTSPDSLLNDLVNIMVETDERFIKVVEDSTCIGVVTRGSLLRGIQGTQEEDLDKK